MDMMEALFEMGNLMFCLNATGPIFLMMVFGLFLRKVGILDEDFANRMNKFVFKIPLPFLLFGDLAAVDFQGFGTLNL